MKINLTYVAMILAWVGVWALVFMLFSGTAKAAIGDISFGVAHNSNSNTVTTPGTVHRIACPNEYVLSEFGWYTRINAGAQNMGFYFNGVWNATTSINSTQQWYYFTGINQPCTQGYVDLTIAGPVNYYSYQAPYTSTGAIVPVVHVQNQTSSLYNIYYVWFTLPLTTGSTGSSSMSSTTIVIDTVPYADWLFVMCIFLFFISLIGWSQFKISRKEKTREKWEK